MRNQKSGHISQVSSTGGRLAIAGNTPYHAAKWAGGGLSDAFADGSRAVLSQDLYAGAGRYPD